MQGRGSFDSGGSSSASPGAGGAVARQSSVVRASLAGDSRLLAAADVLSGGSAGASRQMDLLEGAVAAVRSDEEGEGAAVRRMSATASSRASRAKPLPKAECIGTLQCLKLLQRLLPKEDLDEAFVDALMREILDLPDEGDGGGSAGDGASGADSWADQEEERGGAPGAAAAARDADRRGRGGGDGGDNVLGFGPASGMSVVVHRVASSCSKETGRDTNSDPGSVVLSPVSSKSRPTVLSLLHAPETETRTESKNRLTLLLEEKNIRAKAGMREGSKRRQGGWAKSAEKTGGQQGESRRTTGAPHFPTLLGDGEDDRPRFSGSSPSADHPRGRASSTGSKSIGSKSLSLSRPGAGSKTRTTNDRHGTASKSKSLPSRTSESQDSFSSEASSLLPTEILAKQKSMGRSHRDDSRTRSKMSVSLSRPSRSFASSSKTRVVDVEDVLEDLTPPCSSSSPPARRSSYKTDHVRLAASRARYANRLSYNPARKTLPATTASLSPKNLYEQNGPPSPPPVIEVHFLGFLLLLAKFPGKLQVPHLFKRITKQDVDTARAVFCCFATDGQVVRSEELLCLLRGCFELTSKQLPKSTAVALLEVFDVDKSEKLDFVEFLDCLAAVLRTRDEGVGMEVLERVIRWEGGPRRGCVGRTRRCGRSRGLRRVVVEI